MKEKDQDEMLQAETDSENQDVLRPEEVKDIVTVSIPDEKIEEILQTGGGSDVLWVKFNTSGFVLNDRTLPELQGVLFHIYPHLIRFEGKTPRKEPNVIRDEDIPEGFERRCDIKIQLRECKVGLSLPKTSFYQLKPYVKHLKNQGLRPEQVVTRLRTRPQTNQHGTFAIIVFELLKIINNPDDHPSDGSLDTPRGTEGGSPEGDNPWA
jgi:hypothetical protein